jgi:uncharacterized protein (DUF934 family)
MRKQHYVILAQLLREKMQYAQKMRNTGEFALLAELGVDFAIRCRIDHEAFTKAFWPKKPD